MSLTRFRFKQTAIWLVGLGILAAVVVLSYRMGSTMFAAEFAALTLQKKVAVGGVVVAGVALLGDFWTRSTVEFSALAALFAGGFWFAEQFQEGETQYAQSGREEYDSEIIDLDQDGADSWW